VLSNNVGKGDTICTRKADCLSCPSHTQTPPHSAFRAADLTSVFISELTCRAWLIAESHKRRTLQKSDVAAAIAHSDMFDFLIDIVPRDGDNPDTAGDGAESKAQSVGDDEGQEDGEEDAEDMYREYVDGDG